MMNKKVKISIFKNDPLGIKHEVFMFRLKRLIRKKTKLKIKRIAICLKAVNDINVPKNESEQSLLKKVLDDYDETLMEIENETLYYARMLFVEGVKNETD